MSSIDVVIDARNVTKQFGKFIAVNDITFTVEAGQVVGFVGANGAGKTTTIATLLGFLRASSGEVELFGEVVHPSNAHISHARIGYAAGDMELPAQLTGRQYLGFLRSHRQASDESYQRLIEAFSPQLDKKIHTLSRGNKQKIALVAAFLGEPDLVILDEPTSGLDPVMQETFLNIVLDYKQQGKTVFMSSHYLQEVMEVCDRVLLMSRGRLVQDISTAELQRLGGKQVRVVTTYKSTKAPKGAEVVESQTVDNVLTLRFVFKGDLDTLQRWLAGLKQLQDLEVSEYNLEGAFVSLYDDSQEELND